MAKERKDKHFVKKPVYRGGMKALRTFITQHLQYPEEALKAKVEGTVSLRYSIDHLGKVTKVDIIKGLGHGCDEEAARLVRLLRFEVAKTYKVRVLFHKNLQIHFRLPTEQPKPSPIQYNYISSSEQPPTDNSSSSDSDSDSGSYHYQIEW
ncbi:MAG: energy transducer TonB [Bacteroidota bacterium]